jgi:predicted aspartyl protease
MHLDPAPKELNLGAEAVTVPMDRLHGWAVVEATVNGKRPFRFVLDTGAPSLASFTQVAEMASV